MKRFQVIVTPSAAEDIRTAYAWLMVENPLYAAQWLDDIQSGILGLETLPESHAFAPEDQAFDCEIRHLLVGRGTPWRAFFTMDGETVQVLHIRHGSRDHWRP